MTTVKAINLIHASFTLAITVYIESVVHSFENVEILFEAKLVSEDSSIR